jgi:predicted ATPase
MPSVPRPMRPARPPAGARTPPGRRAGRVTFGVLNFKSIASAQLEPLRLTIVAGSNSSGKSSLLQALLFSAQSFGEPNPVINGDLVRLGEAKDVIRDGMDETTLEFLYIDTHRDRADQSSTDVPRAIRLTLTPRDQGRSLATHEFSLWRSEKCALRAIAAKAPKGVSRAEAEQTLQIIDPQMLNLPEQSYIIVTGVIPTRLAYKADDDKLMGEFDEALETGRTRRWPLEEILRVSRVNTPDEETGRRLGELMNRATHGDLKDLSESERELLLNAFREVEAPEGWVSENIAPMARGRFWRMHSGDEETIDATSIALDIGRGIDHIDRLTSAVLYLGPLRDDPRVAYPLGHTVRALPVGEKGEFTAAYLRENRTVNLSYGKPDGSTGYGKLPSAVNQWCEYLGIAEQIEVNTQGKLGHVLGLRVGGQDRDPTAIGVGASQLLPVVVMVLGAPEGSVVLLEQPELHLHPGVQSRLADFLTYARRDIRIVVETHSEYLLTRLRLRIAEGKLDPDELGVLFATQKTSDDEDSGELYTEFEHLSLDELGDLNRWPDNFFDSLDRDSVDLARAVARKLEIDASSNE